MRRVKAKTRQLVAAISMLGSGIAGASAPGDLDNNRVVDIRDIRIIMAALGSSVAPADPLDIDGDGVVTVFDARQAVLLCNLEICPTPGFPVITSSDTVTVPENQLVAIDLDATDPEGETEGAGLSYRITGGDDRALFEIDTDTGEVSFTVAPDFEAPNDAATDNNYQVQVTVSDSSGATGQQDLAISVQGVNEAPEITGPLGVTGNEDQSFELVLAAADGDNFADELSFTITRLPLNGTLKTAGAADVSLGVRIPVPAGGPASRQGSVTLVYTGYQDYYGADAFSYTVSDTLVANVLGSVQTAPAQTVAILVNPVNDAPAAMISTQVTTSEDTAVVFALEGTDPDGDAVRAVITSLPSTGTLFAVDPAGACTANQYQGAPSAVTIVATEVIGWPVSDSRNRVCYKGLRDDSSEPTMSYVVYDLPSNTNPSTARVSTNENVLTITANPVNDAPVAGVNADYADPSKAGCLDAGATTVNLSALYFPAPATAGQAVYIRLIGQDVDHSQAEIRGRVKINIGPEPALGAFYQYPGDSAPSLVPVATAGPDAGLVTDPQRRVLWIPVIERPPGAGPGNLTETLRYELFDQNGAVSNEAVIIASVEFTESPVEPPGPPPEPPGARR